MFVQLVCFFMRSCVYFLLDEFQFLMKLPCFLRLSRTYNVSIKRYERFQYLTRMFALRRTHVTIFDVLDCVRIMLMRFSFRFNSKKNQLNSLSYTCSPDFYRMLVFWDVFWIIREYFTFLLPFWLAPISKVLSNESSLQSNDSQQLVFSILHIIFSC